MGQASRGIRRACRSSTLYSTLPPEVTSDSGCFGHLGKPPGVSGHSIIKWNQPAKSQWETGHWQNVAAGCVSAAGGSRLCQSIARLLCAAQSPSQQGRVAAQPLIDCDIIGLGCTHSNIQPYWAGRIRDRGELPGICIMGQILYGVAS